MGFIDNIVQSFGMGEMPTEPLFRVTLIGDTAMYIQNVCSIKSYTSEKIELAIKKGGLTVAGNDLFIKKYCAGDLVVCGKIKSLSRI